MMISDLKPYAKYKESGLPWLGDVPGHWDVRRLRASVTDCIGGVWGAEPNGEDDLICVRVADFDRIRLRVSLRKKTVRAIPMSARSRRLLQRGNLLLEKSGGGDLQPVGAVVVYDHDEPAVCSNFVARMPMVAGYNPFYVSYLHFTLYAHRINIRSIKQTTGIQNLDGKAYLSEPVAFPPPDEQAAIVRFLDWATGRLERAIRAKRKVMALLGEQKQAIIHRAVTRGLNPSVPLKSSGIPWLDDIPEHWEVRQLRHMGHLHKGTGGSKEDATPEGVPCIRYGELYFHYRNFIRQPRGFISTDTAATYTPIRFGDVLFAASGERVEEIGKSAVNLYGGAAVCGGDIVIFRPTVAVHAAFLGYALGSYAAAHQKATMCRGTTIKHIYPDELRGLWFCVPPLTEQEKIAATLDNELRGCDTATSRLEREIELLREYRTRLVADVVTGKLDVRDAASRLPDEPPLDPSEAEDDGPDEELEIADEEAAA